MDNTTKADRIVGIDIGGTTIKACLLHDRKLKGKIEVETDARGTTTAILSPLFERIGAEWAGAFDAVGVGVPGYLDVEAGVIRMINNIPAFSGFKLNNAIEQGLGCPVRMDNDANCFVMGEYCFGEASALKHVVGISLGTGVGGGVIINGKVYSGMNSGAGEFGMIPFKDRNFEWYAGSNFFTAFYGLTGKELCERADTGNKDAQEVFVRYGKYLGELLNILMCAYSPEAFIFGGSISGAFRYFMPGIEAGFSKYPVDFMRESVKIYPAAVPDAGMMGAGALWF